MWSFQENIFKTSDAVFTPTIALQNINNSTLCAETGEIFIDNASPNSVVRLEISTSVVLNNEGTATYSYNTPTQNTIHDSTVTTPVYINVDTDNNGEATVTYVVDADPNRNGTGQYKASIKLVDNSNNQIGSTVLNIADSCMAQGSITQNNFQEETSDGSCVTCAVVTVNVPSGLSKIVEFSKTGIGLYSAGLGLCGTVGQTVISDISETISNSKTYRFGIDMSKLGGNPFTTTITVTVKNSTTNAVEDTYVLTRTHSSANC